MKIIDHFKSTVIVRHRIGVRHLGVSHPESTSGKKLTQMIDIVVKGFRFFSCGRSQRAVILHRPADSLPPEFPPAIPGDIAGISSGIYKGPKLLHGIGRMFVSA